MKTPTLAEAKAEKTGVFLDRVRTVTIAGADKRPRKIKHIKVGQYGRQGDILIHRVPDNHAHGELAKTNQLAIGITQGSRHMACGKMRVYEGTALPPTCALGTFLGPCIVAEEEFWIEHPEHAWHYYPAGVYQVTHQTDVRTRERMRD